MRRGGRMRTYTCRLDLQYKTKIKNKRISESTSAIASKNRKRTKKVRGVHLKSMHRVDATHPHPASSFVRIKSMPTVFLNLLFCNSISFSFLHLQFLFILFSPHLFLTIYKIGDLLYSSLHAYVHLAMAKGTKEKVRSTPPHTIPLHPVDALLTRPRLFLGLI